MDSSQYFYRNIMYSKQGDTISIVDIDNPDKEKQKMEPWLGLVIEHADGQHTVNDLYRALATQYKTVVPHNLEKTIHSVVERLSIMTFIVLTKEPTELPYYLSKPIEQLDIEKARKQIKEDIKAVMEKGEN